MTDCCAYDRQFSSRTAKADLRRYRRRGLDKVEQEIVDLVRPGVQNRSVLEVGGGIGVLQLELLKAGAASATSVEMSSEYEETAMRLLEEEDLEGRVRRLIADFAESAASVPAADYVVMNKVLCCYPHMARLLGAAMGRAKRRLVLSFPRDRWLVKLLWWTSDVVSWLRRDDFRSFIHPPRAILRQAEEGGFKVASDSERIVWRTVVLERTG